MAKLRWGLRVVGPSATAAGLVRYGRLRTERPGRTAVLPIRSGGALEVALPGQLVPALAVFGDLIDPEYPFLRRAMRPGAVVVDVGAAVGQFSVFAARIGAGVVHAFEPDPSNVSMLRRNLQRNGVADRVVVHEVAVSDERGDGALQAARRTYGTRVSASADGSDSPVVPVVRLDDLAGMLTGAGAEGGGAGGYGRVDVLKVNVAGDEPAVLAGADRLLTSGRVGVVVVLLSVGVLASLERLAGSGFRFFFFDPDHGSLHEARRFDEGFLHRRPYPARHVIGASEPAVAGGLLEGFGVVTDW